MHGPADLFDLMSRFLFMIRYFPAPDIEKIAMDITARVGIARDFTRVHFMRSTGSKSRRTVARCHTMPRIIQSALSMKGHYVIEVISEHFDKMDEKDRIKTIIHELMHIPKGMRGGFRQHDYVCSKNVEGVYKSYIARKII